MLMRLLPIMSGSQDLTEVDLHMFKWEGRVNYGMQLDCSI